MSNGFDRAEFERWLDAGPNEDVVGLAEEPDACPLAYFLLDLEFERPVVKRTTWSEGPPDGRRHWNLPRWARRFVERVDTDPDLNDGEVTAARAKVILEEVR
jgi:hypothetical protein